MACKLKALWSDDERLVPQQRAPAPARAGGKVKSICKTGSFSQSYPPFELVYDVQFIPTKDEIGFKIRQKNAKMQTQILKGFRA